MNAAALLIQRKAQAAKAAAVLNDAAAKDADKARQGRTALNAVDAAKAHGTGCQGCRRQGCRRLFTGTGRQGTRHAKADKERTARQGTGRTPLHVAN